MFRIASIVVQATSRKTGSDETRQEPFRSSIAEIAITTSLLTLVLKE